MLAGAKALEGMFDFPAFWTIIALAVVAGTYTIYGGLLSVAWTDFLQFVVLIAGGIIVTAIGLSKVGGVFALMHSYPEKFKFIYPATDPNYPWFGVYMLFISIGIWYNCTNQFMVQRCLGARSEWDARMGVVFAGFMKILLPFLVVLPGIVAFRLFPGMNDPDQAYPRLVRELVPLGLGGVVMAGIASSLLSHLSSVLNSSSTVFTMDLYRPLLDRNASDARLVTVGRWAAFVILVGATLLAIWFTHGQHSVFLLIQDVGAWIAAPISVLFILGVLWRRATAAAATFVLFVGFPYTWFVQDVLFQDIAFLTKYNNWLNRTFFVWASCMILMIVVSFFTEPGDPATLDKIIWTPAQAKLPESEKERNRGLRNLFLWWAIFVSIMGMLYAYMLWFQFFGPGKHSS
jgi:SSS family solute:Na+ symporter